MITSPLDVLKKYWGYSSFRPLQEEIIQSISTGNDTLAILPTGGGKSICYQVPAMMQPGLCLVVSPLIALIQDQIKALKSKHIRASMIVSGMNNRQMDQAYGNATVGEYKFLYVSPERLQNDHFLSRLSEMPLSMIAVDEAHCISQWGFDFRPSYLEIPNVREIHQVPIIALTATATKQVEQDVVEYLQLNQAKQFRASVVRNNLSFQVRITADKLPKLREIEQYVPGQSIIYARNRNLTKAIAEDLEQKGFSATYYHAGLSPEARKDRQLEWMKNNKRIIVATNAFGMGIDKADVRSVIHYQSPESIEAYYQEAGRAGRDLKNSFAVLLANQQDIERLEESKESRFPSEKKLKKVLIQLFLYFHISFGAGKDATFPFNLYRFAHQMQLDVNEVYIAIQSLSKQGWLVMNQPFYHPSKFQFQISNTELYSFQVNQPEYEALIKFLLRNYSGIFDQTTAISEEFISKHIQEDAKDIKRKLTFLHTSGIGTYYPQNEDALITFLYERPNHDDFSLDMRQLNFLKQRHSDRVDSMIQFIENPRNQCRMMLIQNYFDETNLEACGICDVCKSNKTQIDEIEIEQFQQQLLHLLQEKSREYEEIKIELNIPDKKVKLILDTLLQEQLIEQTEQNWQIRK